MKIYTIHLILLFMIAPFYVSAQNEGITDTIGGKQVQMNLQQCIEKALDENYSIKIMHTAEQIADNNADISPFLPTVRVDLQQSQRINNTKTVNSGTTREISAAQNNSLSAGLGITWRLFDGLAMFTNYERANELLALGELNTKLSVENLVLDVSTAYYNVIVQHSKLDAAKHSLSLSQERFTEAKDKYMLGVVSGLDMQQSKLDLNADSSDYMKQKELLKAAYITLNMIMNAELQDEMYVNDSIMLGERMYLNELKNQTVRNNTLLEIARKQQTVSALDVKLARASYFPTLDFSGGYNVSRAKTPESVTTYNRSYGPYLGFNISVNVFNRLETRRAVRNAKLQQEQTSLSYSEAELQTLADLAQLYNTYENNLQIVNFENESTQVAMENLDAALEKYKLGTLSGIEFREFQRSYINANDRRLSAIYQAKVSELELLMLSGGIMQENED